MDSFPTTQEMKENGMYPYRLIPHKDWNGGYPFNFIFWYLGLPQILNSVDTAKYRRFMRVYNQVRRAKKSSYKARYYIEELRRIYGERCGICGESLVANDNARNGYEKWSTSVDHIVPLSKNGPDLPLNWQPSHKGCNNRKSNKEVKPAIIVTGNDRIYIWAVWHMRRRFSFIELIKLLEKGL